MALVRRALFALSIGLLAATAAPAEDKKAPAAGGGKRVLLVTHSGGFVHDSLGFAEDTLKQIGPAHGLAVSAWRFTGDPAAKAKDGKSALAAYSERFRGPTGKPVGPENCGRINKETLKDFDCVLFFTTGDPLTKDELADLTDWVKAGGAFAGIHCATDTLYSQPAYGELIGAYFGGHPPITTVKVKVDDPKHPAAAAFRDGESFTDEIYVFREKGNFKVQPFSRDKVHVVLSCAPGSFDPKGISRADNDYALSWAKDYGKGKVFYTAFGHRKEVWKDPRFQAHLVAGLKWAMNEPASVASGSSAPAAK